MGSLYILYQVLDALLSLESGIVAMSSSKLYLAVVGVGGVGTAFLSQLSNLPTSLRPTLIFLSRSAKQLYTQNYDAISPSDLQSLIPKELESAGSSDEFMERLPEFDGEMEGYKDQAAREGKVVRYVGSVDVGVGKVKVGLEMVERGTPIASLRGSDNLICFYTKRYGANPLVIQGAGAGGEVTAMGVTADLIKVVERLR